jgi:hypothetical protein
VKEMRNRIWVNTFAATVSIVMVAFNREAMTFWLVCGTALFLFTIHEAYDYGRAVGVASATFGKID